MTYQPHQSEDVSLKTADRPKTPKDLERAGYRIEYGVPEERGSACYWWTWSEGSSVIASEGDFETAQAAETDAYQHLVNDRWDEAMAYFGLDPSFMYDQGAMHAYVLEMLADQAKTEKAFELLRRVKEIIQGTYPAEFVNGLATEDRKQLSCADVVQCLCEMEKEINEVLSDA